MTEVASHTVPTTPQTTVPTTQATPARFPQLIEKSTGKVKIRSASGHEDWYSVEQSKEKYKEMIPDGKYIWVKMDGNLTVIGISEVDQDGNWIKSAEPTKTGGGGKKVDPVFEARKQYMIVCQNSMQHAFNYINTWLQITTPAFTDEVMKQQFDNAVTFGFFLADEIMKKTEERYK